MVPTPERLRARDVMPHVGWACLFYTLGMICVFTNAGSPYAWLLAVLFSALPIFHILCDAEDKEGRSFTEVLALRGNSKAFTLGDYGLLLAIGFMASVWTADHVRNMTFVLCSILVGMLVGAVSPVVLRVFDRPRYKWEKALHLFYRSPTKLGHDFDELPTLIAMLTTLGSPLLLQWHWQTISAALGVLWWLVWMVYDLINPPNPHRQHALAQEHI